MMFSGWLEALMYFLGSLSISCANFSSEAFPPFSAEIQNWVVRRTIFMAIWVLLQVLICEKGAWDGYFHEALSAGF